MALTDHVSITITRDSSGVARAGFGKGLLLSYNTSGWGATRVRSYSSYADVITDFPVTTGPEALAAEAYFGQNPHPETLYIGRGALPPTKKFTLTPTARDSHVYRLRLGGDGVTTTTVTFTSDSPGTAAEIVTGMITACNAVVGKNFTATGSTTLILTGNTAGEWFFCEVLDVNDFALEQDHADPGVATDLAACLVASQDWYGLMTVYNSDAYVKAAAAWAAANFRLYLWDNNDSECVLEVADGTQGLHDDIDALNYSYVASEFHPREDEMLSVSHFGACLPLEPGSETWAYKELSGVSAASLTSTHRTNLDARNAGYFKSEAGKSFTWEGKTSDGDYIDVRRGLDWIIDDLSKSVFEVLLGLDKVPFTDYGVSLIKGAVAGSLGRAAKKGIITVTYTVTVPKVADVSTSDKSARKLPDVKFTATLQGSIHKVKPITGTISV